MNPVKLTHAAWLAEAERRYGNSLRNIRFTCPACGHVQSGQDYLDLGLLPEDAAKKVGFSCIGRLMPDARDAFGTGPGPCNYAGGGLLRIAPIAVEIGEDEPLYVFDFADEPLATASH